MSILDTKTLLHSDNTEKLLFQNSRRKRHYQLSQKSRKKSFFIILHLYLDVLLTIYNCSCQLKQLPFYSFLKWKSYRFASFFEFMFRFTFHNSFLSFNEYSVERWGKWSSQIPLDLRFQYRIKFEVFLALLLKKIFFRIWYFCSKF